MPPYVPVSANGPAADCNTQSGAPGGDRRLGTYLTEGGGGAFTGFDITFGWEDLPFDGTDNDFQDVVFGCIDCVEVGGVFEIEQVPEPAPLFLMGLGLLALRSQLKRKGKLGSFQVK